MGNRVSSWSPPKSTVGQKVYMIEKPIGCCPPPPSFDPDEPMPLELEGVSDQYKWSQFARQLHETAAKFWDRKLQLVPFLAFGCCFMILPLVAFSMLFFHETQIVTSNGSPVQPYCISDTSFCPSSTACALELCRASLSKFKVHAKFINATGVNGGTVCWMNRTAQPVTPSSLNASQIVSEIKITAECGGVPAWTLYAPYAVFGTMFLLMFSIWCGQFTLITHNQQVDSNIQKLVSEFRSQIGRGAELEYIAMFNGYCKPKGARPWRCLVVRNCNANPTPVMSQLVGDSSDSEDLEKPLRA